MTKIHDMQSIARMMRRQRLLVDADGTLFRRLFYRQNPQYRSDLAMHIRGVVEIDDLVVACRIDAQRAIEFERVGDRTRARYRDLVQQVARNREDDGGLERDNRKGNSQLLHVTDVRRVVRHEEDGRGWIDNDMLSSSEECFGYGGHSDDIERHSKRFEHWF